jgi:hypothetical protein
MACIVGASAPPSDPPATATGVQVTTTVQASTLFMPILGFNNLRVDAIAAAHGTPPSPGGPGYGIFAIKSGQPPGSGVIGGSFQNWHFTGTVHSNSDVSFSGSGNTFDGKVQYVTGTRIPSGQTYVMPDPNNPGATVPDPNDPVQSAVLPDPVNKTPADFYQGTTSTATYQYINGSTNLSSYMTNGVLQSGVYYVNGDINFSTSMSTTTASVVTLIATGKITISDPSPNFTPYQQGMLFFSNLTSNNDGINISASGSGTIRGLVYAPHSDLRYSGSQNIVGGGSLVANTITITNNNGSLTYDPSIFPSNSIAEIFLYK